MNVEEYVNEETDDVSEDGIDYAEVGDGHCWLMYHNAGESIWKDRPEYELRTVIYGEHGRIYQNNEELSEEEAERLLEKWNGWDYAE